MRDLSKVKSALQAILDDLGCEEEGENPDLPKQDNAMNNGGQDTPKELFGSSGMSDEEKKKKSSIALMGATLAQKYKK